MLGPPLLSSPFLMILLEGLCRSEREVEFARVRRVLIDCWWARVRARRRELRCRARSSAEGGSPKMKNFMKQNMSSAIESWPRRKPCVKERLGDVSCDVQVWGIGAYDEPACATGSAEGVGVCFAMVRSTIASCLGVNTCCCVCMLTLKWAATS